MAILDAVWFLYLGSEAKAHNLPGAVLRQTDLFYLET